MKHHVTNEESARRGFTLLEVLVTVGTLAVLAAMGLVAMTAVQDGSSNSKLKMDVATINSAAKLYMASGGKLDTVSSPHTVLRHLQTQLSKSQYKEMMGMKGSMVDPRLKAVLQTSEEALQEGPRAVWNETKKRFDIVDSGPLGVKAFILDDAGAASDAKETREMSSVKFAKADNWIWDYEDREQTARAGMSSVPTTTDVDESSAGTSSPVVLQLDPPTFSIPAGSYPLGDYRLSVALTNPNPTGSSTVLYSTTPGVWMPYAGAFDIDPGVTISSYVASNDPDTHSDSILERNRYETDEILLGIALEFEKTAYNYIELGGPLEPGDYEPPITTGPANIIVENTTNIPEIYLNDGNFQVYWTFDGSDPLTSTTRTEGAPFENGHIGQEVSLGLSTWGQAPEITVQAVAQSRNTNIFTDSPVVDQTLTIETIALGGPVIERGDYGLVTMSLQVDEGDVPYGARVYYTTDGGEPGVDNEGNPTGGTLYTGPFDPYEGESGDPGASVVARVYAPEQYLQWFTPSEAVAEDQAPAFPLNAVLSQDTTSKLYRIEVDPDLEDGSYSQITPPDPSGNQYNAIGYRTSDGVLYGMNPQTGALLKVNMATGGATVLANLGLTQSFAGDFNTANGLYYVKRKDHSKFYVIDVDTRAVVQQIPITPAIPSVGDITYNADDGKFYCYKNKQLYAIDATTGAASIFPAHADNPDGHAGASFSENGNVFLALNTGGLYWADTSNGKTRWIADSPASSRNDGALVPVGGGGGGGDDDGDD